MKQFLFQISDKLLVGKSSGYSLVELILVIVVIAVLASVSMRSMGSLNDISKTEETRQELDQLAYAIAGNADLVSAGVRTDYGYIGDVGALPANLDALITNPGSYATWDGPYIKDELSAGGADIYFKSDAWGTTYTYAAGNTIASTGGPASMTREIANSTAELLSNSVAVTITDLNGTPPGSVYKDSVKFILSYPDGAGGTTTTNLSPSANGFIEVSSIPIGMHSLQIVYQPTNDTLRRKVNVDPGQDYYAEISLFADVWLPSGGGGGGGSVEILRPMGVGTITELLDSNCTGNWSCVDEITADDDGTFVEGVSNSWNDDLYATENSTVGAGTIDSVILYARCAGTPGTERLRTLIRTGGSSYQSTAVFLTATYIDYSKTYIDNPKSNSAWTWAEIDAVEIGVTLKQYGKSTQVWLEVYYTP